MLVARLTCLITLVTLVAGCPQSQPLTEDAALADAVVEAPDVGVPDSGSDAGPPDADGDGTPDATDCDPSDADVGRAGTRTCSNECTTGVERCTDGIWGACSASTSCFCDSEGMRRTAACGMCGTRAEECRAGVWTAASSCTGEHGHCVPTAVENEERPNFCQLLERVCGDDCEWGEWVSVYAGECERGIYYCDTFSSRDQCCTDDCRIVDNPCCPDGPPGCVPEC